MRRDFVANVSRGLHLPVSIIGANVETLAEALNDPIRGQEFWVRCGATRGSCRTYVNELLDLSRIEAGSYEVDLKPDGGGPVERCSICSETRWLGRGLTLRSVGGSRPRALCDARSLVRM